MPRSHERPAVMHVTPASRPSVHASPTPAPSSPPARPFSSHLADRSRKTARTSTSAKAGAAQATTASGGAVGAAPAAGSGAASTTGSSATSPASDAQSSITQSQDDNMQFLALQSQLDTQSEMFTAMSNVEKTQTDTLKNTAQNMAI